MREAASQVLSSRAIEPENIQRNLAVSLGVHLVLLLFLYFSPASWLSSEASNAQEAVMTISLGGPQGPGEGGLTPLGGRPIQEILALTEARRPQWIQPPTPTPPRMTAPAEEAFLREEIETTVESAPEEARGRTPTRGSELVEGTAMADTGVEGLGLGLSTGGLGGNETELSVGDFCCPDYLATMINLIRRRWDPNQQVHGISVVRFTIQRSGSIEDVVLQRGSGYFALDMSAQRAILMTGALPQLPSAFPNESLRVSLTFEYRQ